MENEEVDMEEFPEEEDFGDELDNDDISDEYQDDSDDDDAEELFRQNPLRAIFVRQGEILEALNES